MEYLRKGIDGVEYMEAVRDQNPEVHWPQPDCPLMKKKMMEYSVYLDQKKRRVSKFEFNNFRYVVNQLDVTPNQVCFYMFICYIERNNKKRLLELPEWFGFDADCPPDILYSLLLLHQFAGDAEIFKYLYKKHSDAPTKTDVKALLNMVSKGKIIKLVSPLPPAFSAKLRRQYNAYNFLKFKMAEANERLEDIVEAAKTDPVVRHIFQEFSPHLQVNNQMEPEFT